VSTLLTESDVAKQLQISVAALRKWRIERRGPRFIKVGSLVRYKPEDLFAWLGTLAAGGSIIGENREKRGAPSQLS
jgi:Helix-turn-helix domain